VGVTLISNTVAHNYTEHEKQKICAFFVHPRHRRQHIAESMFKFGTKRETDRQYVGGIGESGSSYLFRKLDIKLI
jgi:hypothetical protein